MTAEIIKSILPTGLGLPGDYGLPAQPAHREDEWAWPVSPYAMARLWGNNADHARACQVKGEGSAGRGWVDATDKVAQILDVERLTRMAVDLEAYGNAFVEIVRDRAGRPSDLNILPAPTCALLRAGGIRQRTWDGHVAKVAELPAADCLHLRALCPLGHPYAVPSWLGAAGMMDLVHAATRYNARFFEAGAMPEYAVVHEGQALSDTQRATVREFFRNEFQNVERSRRTLVLSLAEGQKIRFERITSDQDGQYLKLIEAARNLIPGAHGVPPRLLGIVSPGSLGGAGEVTGQMHAFEQFTLVPRRRRLVHQLAPLLLELGADPRKIALQAVDLTPAGDDAKDIPALVAAGVVTPDEARAWLELDTLAAKSISPLSQRGAGVDSAEALMLRLLDRL